MANIVFRSVEDIENFNSSFKASQEKIREELNRLKAHCDELKEHWRDEGGNNFQDAMAKDVLRPIYHFLQVMEDSHFQVTDLTRRVREMEGIIK